MEKRVHPRRVFEFLVLEHRPDGADHPQATRMLECVDFSEGGLKLLGQPRFQRCNLTLAMPNSDQKVTAEVEVVREGADDFGVKFVSPSDELLSQISWWRSSPDQNLDSDA